MALRADDVDLGRDRDLVARFQSGDPEAFDDLYRRYFDRLHRYCLRHTRDSHEAEEVAQEAFVKALRSMHTLDGERRFYPWMTVIAKRITIDRHRKLSRIELTDEPDLGSVDPDVDHLFAEVDAGHVRAAMDKLGPRHREVLLLREAEGLSYADIAHHLEVPLTTVEALLHRARKALRREYAAVGGDRRGSYGLPVLAWLSTRVAEIRTKLGDRWVEVGAVATPLAVGAATAAFVLVPGGDARPERIETAEAPAVIVEAVEGATSSTASPDLEPDAPAAEAPATAAAPAAPVAGPPPPAVDAGPVDVFIGPDGTDRARESAEEMPLHGAVGPATGGTDPPMATEHVDEFVDDVVRVIAGTAGDHLPGGNP